VEPLRTLRIALAQINTVVGDFARNTGKIRTHLEQARALKADLVLFPELAIPGYPPEDLLLKPDFVKENVRALKSLLPYTHSLTAVIGFAEPHGGHLYNSAAVVANGKWLGNYRKILLPNYGVFDEKRYFKEGAEPARLVWNDIVLGLSICEDLWEENGPGKTLCKRGGFDVLLNISSSPFHTGKARLRREMIRKRARQYGAHVVYANLVGGQDELVFDGHSLIVAPDGEILAEGASFAEDLIVADLRLPPARKPRHTGANAAKKGVVTWRTTAPIPQERPPLTRQPAPKKTEIEEIFAALVLGTRDYLEKNGFQTVALGLSGGIDSAVTAVIAVAALGAQNVVGVLMPSPFSSRGSLDDSHDLARNLEIGTLTLPIEKAMRAYDEILAEPFRDTLAGVAEENLQARIRGNLLMALSNKLGWLALTTGNKSEISVGYCTLYGDMAGGLAVIKDVPKTRIYELARHINRQAGTSVIPDAIITKEPSAELRPNQKDTDSLPPYPVLDAILQKYVEEDRSVEDLIRLGHPPALALRVARLVDRNEYKRRQGPPGIKITPKAFGKDRRLPITNHYLPTRKK
jgi:NAD+ synthase (glutamine-hydrolysing)